VQLENYHAVQELSQEVIHRIAAGEVVDRPVSIVKELVENSLDAQATEVKISIVSGGLDLVEIEDNGWGLSREDLSICLRRHATSKIQSLDDLDHILSLGFRGEALSAVSSVADVQIDTYSAFQKAAWVLRSHPNAVPEIEPGVRQEGTKISIQNLFETVPTRKKFLKKSTSEASVCRKLIRALCLTREDVSFSSFILNASGELKAHDDFPIESISDRFARFLETDAENLFHFQKSSEDQFLSEGVKSLECVFSKPGFAFRHQKNIQLVVNGRLVSDPRLAYALREAYSGLIEVGAYPAVLVRLEIDPALIDVNIHPQKKELRWPSHFSLSSIVYKSIRAFLFQGEKTFDVESPRKQGEKMPETFSKLEVTATTPSANSSWHSKGHEPSTERFHFNFEPLLNEKNNLQSSSSLGRRPDFSFAQLRVIGEMSAAWILCESEQGLMLLDQHAAHERLNFDRILKNKKLLRAKALLVSMEIELPLAVQAYRQEIKDFLEKLSFEFSENESALVLELIAIPESDRKINWKVVIENLFQKIEEGSAFESVQTDLENRIAASMACHGSVRRGQRLSREGILELLKDLDSIEWASFCPHGRPIYYLISNEKIEDFFHR